MLTRRRTQCRALAEDHIHASDATCSRAVLDMKLGEALQDLVLRDGSVVGSPGADPAVPAPASDLFTHRSVSSPRGIRAQYRCVPVHSDH